MSQLSIKRINNEEVKPVKFVEEDKDKRPIAGASIFPEIYSTIFFCARKKSGKTCAVAHIIDKCAIKETKVIAFVSTLHRDPTWRAIEHMCEKKGIDFTGYTSIRDDSSKEDILGTIMTTLEEIRHDENDKLKESSQPQAIADLPTLGYDDESSIATSKQKKPKKPKFKGPEIIFVFDDLSGELQTPSLVQLLKKNRHFRCKVLISSQYWNDIPLQGRRQMDYVLLFKGLSQSPGKLKEIYDNCDLPVPFEVFTGIYKFCTAERFNFMYLNVPQGEFRKNFTYRIDLPKEHQED